EFWLRTRESGRLCALLQPGRVDGQHAVFAAGLPAHDAAALPRVGADVLVPLTPPFAESATRDAVPWSRGIAARRQRSVPLRFRADVFRVDPAYGPPMTAPTPNPI